VTYLTNTPRRVLIELSGRVLARDHLVTNLLAKLTYLAGDLVLQTDNDRGPPRTRVRDTARDLTLALPTLLAVTPRLGAAAVDARAATAREL